MPENTLLYERLNFQKPQVNLARSTAGRMWLVSLSAFMAIVQSAVSDNFSSLIVALSAVAAAVLTEFLILKKRGMAFSLKDGSAAASALVFALLLPNRIPPVYAVIGAVFAMAVVKHSFGGLGSNWLNPAAGGWLFVRLSWPGAFSAALEGSPLSLLSGSLSRGFANPQGSPLGILKIDSGGLFAAPGAVDSLVRSFFNNFVFSFTGAELPGGYIDLFASPGAGIIADRGVLALLLGTIIIAASQAAGRAWVPAVWIAVFGFLVRMAGGLPYGGGWWSGDTIFALCSGGTLAAAFFLAADPATGAKSNLGILAASVAGGAGAFLFRYLGAEPYGAVFAALLINAVLPLVRNFESRRFYEKRRKAL
ncbi:MAG: RnfABCDGE type electron transport complex subunit D [Treponema sp.]|jgi:electron transport complex protein RnfD|nr:RnfABCDGE type electron transport complex subunit D [Treponema sp.]